MVMMLAMVVMAVLMVLVALVVLLILVMSLVMLVVLPAALRDWRHCRSVLEGVVAAAVYCFCWTVALALLLALLYSNACAA